MRARPRDSQVDLGKVSHQRNQALKAFHLDQASCGRQVGAGSLFGHFVLDPTGPIVGQEIGGVDQGDEGVETAAPMFFERVPARE